MRASRLLGIVVATVVVATVSSASVAGAAAIELGTRASALVNLEATSRFDDFHADN